MGTQISKSVPKSAAAKTISTKASTTKSFDEPDDSSCPMESGHQTKKVKKSTP